MNIMDLKCYKIYDDATIPTFASSGSACFDMYAYLPTGSKVKVYNDMARKIIDREVRDERIILYPSERALIPTGIIMDIPENHSVRLHARSGLAWKQGITLANSEGVIDSDYVNEVMALLINTSEQNVIIDNGTRVCQGEMVKTLKYSLQEIDVAPETKTDREGGFGSTGVK